jgi:hypothetical protein
MSSIRLHQGDAGHAGIGRPDKQGRVGKRAGITISGGAAYRERPDGANATCRGTRHSRRSVPTNRSVYKFARGDRTGVLITRVPLPDKTPSNAAVNLLSLSRIRVPGSAVLRRRVSRRR